MFDDILKNILKERFTGLVEKLKEKHLQLGMKASGDWLNSLELEVTGNKVIIKANHYTQYLTKGRPPGKRPIIKKMMRYVKYKFGYTGERAKRAAFRMANKIAKEGTRHYPQGTDLVDGVIYKEAIKELNLKIGTLASFELNKILTRQLQTA